MPANSSPSPTGDGPISRSTDNPEIVFDRYIDGEEIAFRIREKLFDGHSEYQHIQIHDLELYGRTLLLDGNVQSSSSDEVYYHEALIQPAMLGTATPPKRVLILGGGEGASLREVLKHPSVERAVMVDLDRLVVDACREHMPTLHAGAFDDPRAEIRCEDAGRYVSEHEGQFDVILFDIVDPADAGPAAHLFEPSYFRLLKKRLAPGGVLAMQYGAAFGDHLATAKKILTRLAGALPAVLPGRVFIPSFHGAWGIAIASETPVDLSPETLRTRTAERMPVPPVAADEHWIQALFTLPKDIRQVLGSNQP